MGETDRLDLDRIEELCGKCTPPPWNYDGMHDEVVGPDFRTIIWSIFRVAPDDELLEDDEFGHHYHADFDLMAQSRTLIPALVAELRAERARVREAEAQVEADRRKAIDEIDRLTVEIRQLEWDMGDLTTKVRELEGENDSMGVLCGLQSGHIAKLEGLLRRVLAGQAIDGYALSHELIDEITEAL